jgi:hypothetical protein
MNSRRPQIVLIAFAVASWVGAVIELGAATGCDNDDCLEHGVNCSNATGSERPGQGASYCEGERCFTFETASGPSDALVFRRAQ